MIKRCHYELGMRHVLDCLFFLGKCLSPCEAKLWLFAKPLMKQVHVALYLIISLIQTRVCICIMGYHFLVIVLLRCLCWSS